MESEGLGDPIVGAAISYLQASRLLSSELCRVVERLFHVGREFNKRWIVQEFEEFSCHRVSAYVILTEHHQILLMESILVKVYRLIEHPSNSTTPKLSHWPFDQSIVELIIYSLAPTVVPIADIMDVNNLATTTAMSENDDPNDGTTPPMEPSQQTDDQTLAFVFQRQKASDQRIAQLITENEQLRNIVGNLGDPSHIHYSGNNPTWIHPPWVNRGFPPTRAFDLQKAISEAVDKSIKGMERKLLQTLGHLATYKDLLDEVTQ
ncbi:hypothetical protein TIFTF001_027443 [Ficus carica]|uniref:Uncharacterized protein n=1 Tax=Ficus carica TaxID=3494 RepID=A0AA88J099_FICCA|nr:hypothetical protein TIFTF001_027443 [Ficus carica]